MTSAVREWWVFCAFLCHMELMLLSSSSVYIVHPITQDGPPKSYVQESRSKLKSRFVHLVFGSHTLSGWWFGIVFILPWFGNFIIPTDFHTLQMVWNHQLTSSNHFDTFWSTLSRIYGLYRLYHISIIYPSIPKCTWWSMILSYTVCLWYCMIVWLIHIAFTYSPYIQMVETCDFSHDEEGLGAQQ